MVVANAAAKTFEFMEIIRLRNSCKRATAIIDGVVGGNGKLQKQWMIDMTGIVLERELVVKYY